MQPAFRHKSALFELIGRPNRTQEVAGSSPASSISRDRMPGIFFVLRWVWVVSTGGGGRAGWMGSCPLSGQAGGLAPRRQSSPSTCGRSSTRTLVGGVGRCSAGRRRRRWTGRRAALRRRQSAARAAGVPARAVMQRARHRAPGAAIKAGDMPLLGLRERGINGSSTAALQIREPSFSGSSANGASRGRAGRGSPREPA